LAETGAHGVNFHDNDLELVTASAAKQSRIVSDFKRARDSTGLEVPTATTNLFADPVFKGGAFTSSDANDRACALQKTMPAFDFGVELGARGLQYESLDQFTVELLSGVH
jgi:xylose isomerase